MSKRIALIGHCGPDSSYLRMAVGRAGRDIEIIAADDGVDLQRVLDEGVDLLLFNRVLDYGFEETEGVELLRKLRNKHPELKMMLVSNYPEAQDAAVKAGALPGFGKREIGSPRVTEMIREAITSERQSTTKARRHEEGLA
jgi:two-component system, chemotaxis family, chemotaxis protein CheY